MNVKSNVLKIANVVLCSMLLSSCARIARPNLWHGRYYMTGDDNCIYFRHANMNMYKRGIIECYTDDKQYTGLRSAMTNQDMQMYQIRQQQMQAQNQAAMAQFSQAAQNITNANNSMATQYNQMAEQMRQQNQRMGNWQYKGGTGPSWNGW
ncbi:hypothetical protein [Lonepinella sp. BR2919]|uniref:hypothetical protein n=1 Tax=unclassified Lonepinella TaxID=2642006 RepID=UPI003F6E3A93